MSALNLAPQAPVVAASSAIFPTLPAALADIALIDGPTCAAARGVSISQWHELVRTHEAPQPAIRQPRYTRWRVCDIREHLISIASAPPSAASTKVISSAKAASLKAREPAAVAKAQATRKARIAARSAAAGA